MKKKTNFMRYIEMGQSHCQKNNKFYLRVRKKNYKII